MASNLQQRTLKLDDKIFYCYSDGSVEFFYKTRNYSKLRRSFGNGCSYKRKYLHLQFKDKSYAVHRLIAMAFVPNPENKPEVDHINRNPSDNRPENLRWVTKVENMENHSQTINAIKKYGFKPKDNKQLWQKIYTKEYGKLYRMMHKKLAIIKPDGKETSKNFNSDKDPLYILLKPLTPSQRYKKLIEYHANVVD